MKTRLLMIFSIIGLSALTLPLIIYEIPSKENISDNRESLKEVVFSSTSCASYWHLELRAMWDNQTYDYKNDPIFIECSNALESDPESDFNPVPEPEPIHESETLQKQKQQQAKLHVQEVILTDYRGNEHQIDAINEYRNEFESDYFLEQFILFTNKQNYEKDDLINFVFIEWGYQSQECTSPKVEVYLRPYENYGSIEKISEWQKSEEECHSIDSDSNGYLIVNIWPMPGMPVAYQTCIIPGEYGIAVSNLNDKSKKELEYFTCQKEKLVGEPQPWMKLPEKENEN